MIQVPDETLNETLTRDPREFEFLMASMVRQVAASLSVPVRMLQMEPIHNSHVVEWIRAEVIKL